MNLQSLQQALEDAVQPLDTLTHPFYRAWTEGMLTGEALAWYAAQYRHSVEALPELLGGALARTADPETRAGLRRNLDEEEGRVGTAHARLWAQFSRAVGAEEEAPLAETEGSRERLAELVEAGEVSALAALWAYERQTARVSETKRAGLRLYGIEAPEAVAFFQVHQELDVHHAQDLLEGLGRACARGGSVDEACAAAKASAQAQWLFLDGVERLRQSPCAVA
jgi:pyrroloquinoline quinone (PQQ) biosynthesis protein C